MPSVSEQIYQASPVWAQQMMVATYGWWWYKRRFGPTFHRLVGEFKGRDRWSAQQFRAYQEDRLRDVFAAAGIRRFGHRLKEAGVFPAQNLSMP